MDIRPLVLSDEPAWRELWTAYLEFYGATVGEDVFQTTFARLIEEDSQDFCGRLAFHEGRAVGLVHFLSHRHCWRVENVIYLQDLYVSPDARGAGVGHALIDSVYAYGDTAGTPSVYWLTQDFNAQARRLYDQVADVTPFIKYQRRAS